MWRDSQIIVRSLMLHFTLDLRFSPLLKRVISFFAPHDYIPTLAAFSWPFSIYNKR